MMDAVLLIIIFIAVVVWEIYKMLRNFPGVVKK